MRGLGRLNTRPVHATGPVVPSYTVSPLRPLACSGTFFQLVDYSAITKERDIDFAQRLTREHGVAAIPISPFLSENEEPGPVVRFCFAKRDETLQAAAERLRRV